MSRLKRIVDSYMQKVSGIEGHCDRCLRTERWGGSVVLMVVDAFCGRIPRSVLARHYTDYSPNVLKEIYDSAKLQILRENYCFVLA